MAPPAYSDLGKQAKDLFNKNYHFGLVKLDCKTKTPTGVEFAVSGTSHNDTGRVNGSLETKYKISDYGVTLKEKWNTDNTLATEVSVEDQLVKGLKLAFDATFAPQSGTGEETSTTSSATTSSSKPQIDKNIRITYGGGRKQMKESFSVTCVFRSRKKTGTVKSSYKLDHINLNTDVDFDYAGPIIHGAGVIHYQGWLAGAQLSFDTGKSKLTKSNFAVGYQTPEFVLHTNVNDGQEFGGSVYQRVNDQLETGILLNWTAGSNATRFGLGCIYKLDKATSVRAKVNNSSQVGLGFSHKLRDGVSLTLSAIIEGKNINQGGHKLGLGLDIEA